METGRVRAILAFTALGREGASASAGRAAPDGASPWAGDPNLLLDAWVLDDRLRGLPEAEQRSAAEVYVRLWARTFRTLVAHLRGRPERALSLFVAEVYPFLRGDRLAARVESVGRGGAQVSLQGGLPPAYLAGLVESFVALSGARVAATVLPGPAEALRLDLAWRMAPGDRLARLVQQASLLRIPLLACALLGALLGLALAARLGGPLEPWRVAAVLLGAVAVQVGANALHDLRIEHPAGPLGKSGMGRRALVRTAWLGHGVAALLGAVLAWQNWAVLLFAAAGLAVSTLFAPLRSRGWGPALTGLTYGPLLAEGALHAALPGAAAHAGHLAAVAWTLPVGLFAAALVYLDEVADRPLDEAGGQRTLLVRLPEGRHWPGLALLVAPAAAGLVAATAAAAPTLLPPALGVAAAALVLLAQARPRAGDPHALAPLRLGLLGVHAATVLLLALAAVAA